jgi:hypothetical protein
MIHPFSELLSDALKKFNEKRYEESSAQIAAFMASNPTWNADALHELCKFQYLFFMGQSFGLPTLNLLLNVLGIVLPKDISYSNIHKQLNCNEIHQINEYIFVQNATVELEKLARQSASRWSSANVTVVEDGSVFKHLGNCTSGYQDFWFSGQTQSTVKGFKCLTVGMVIQDLFYPLYYDFVQKTTNPALAEAKAYAKKCASRVSKIQLQVFQAEAKVAQLLAAAVLKAQKKVRKIKNNAPITPKKSKITPMQAVVEQRRLDLANAREASVQARLRLAPLKAAETPNESPNSESEVACQLLRKVGLFWKSFQSRHPHLPSDLFVSMDNGFNTPEIIECCDQNPFILICVPKQNEKVTIANVTQSLHDWIETEFLPREQAHHAKQKPQKTSPKKQQPFFWRVKAFYKAKNRLVTLLFFRLNRSKKVTIIYCPDTHAPNIFAKTMRHHWFARTQIEQFFRTVKHILKIQETKTQNLVEMDTKIGRFFWLGFDAQLLTRFIRKKINLFRKKGFKQIIKYILIHLDPFEEINHLVQSLFFARNQPIER